MNTSVNFRIKYTIVSLSLIVSFLIYHLYRAENILLNTLLDGFHVGNAIREYHKPPLSEWAIYSLPGALWVLASTLLATDLVFASKRWRNLLILLPTTVAIGIEFFQYLSWTDGRFDWGDVYATVGGFFIALLVYRFSIPFSPRNKYSFVLMLSSYALLILADVV